MIAAKIKDISANVRLLQILLLLVHLILTCFGSYLMTGVASALTSV